MSSKFTVTIRNQTGVSLGISRVITLPGALTIQKGRGTKYDTDLKQILHKRWLTFVTATLEKLELYSNEVATALSILRGLFEINFRATQEKSVSKLHSTHYKPQTLSSLPTL